MSRRFLWLCLALAVLVGLLPLSRRITAERANRDVDVVLHFQDLVDFCQAEGLVLSETLTRFRRAGVTALAYSENSLDRLNTASRVSAYSAADLLRAIRTGQEPLPAGFSGIRDLQLNRSRLYLLVKDADALDELQTYLKLSLGTSPPSNGPSPAPTVEPAAQRFAVLPSGAAPRQPDENHPVLMELATSQRALMAAGLGFSRQDLEVAHSAHLHIYLRPQNRSRFQDSEVRDYVNQLAQLRPLGVRGFIFEGSNNEVLGYPDSVKVTVEEMRANNLLFGNIEVPTAEAAQKGSRTLGVDMAEKTVRVMSVTPALQTKLTPADAVDRFALGVRERNIRVAYVRFFAAADSGKSLADTNLDYVKNLTEELSRPPSWLREKFAGGPFRMAAAQPFPHVGVGKIPLALLSLGAAAGGLLVLAYFVEVPGAVYWLVMLVAPLGALAAATVGRSALWAKMVSVETALVIPVLGLAFVLPWLVQLPIKVGSWWKAVLSGCMWLTILTGLNVSGGIIVTGVLSSTPFMLEADQFRGIKFIMVLGPLLVVYHFLTRSSPQPRKLSDLASIRVVFWHLGAMVVLLAAMAFYIERTGNASPAAASDLERTVRTFLENLMVARPRFKEFALGHPALIVLALLCWQGRAQSGLWALVLAVAIGQVDVIDTFCHVHTPYLISLLRVLHGWWLGLLLGVTAAGVMAVISGKGEHSTVSRNTNAAYAEPARYVDPVLS